MTIPPAFSQRVAYIVGQVIAALRDPANNPRVALLVFLAVGVVLLLVAVLVYLAVYAIQEAREPQEEVWEPAPPPSPGAIRARRIALVVLAVLLVVGLAVGWNRATTDYACSRCHYNDAAFASRANATHAAVSCSACHVAPGARGAFDAAVDGAANLRVQFFHGTRPAGTGTFVANESCLTCHRVVTSGVMLARGIRMRHSDVLGIGYACTDCHNTAGHGDKVSRPRFPDMSQCIMCHDGVTARNGCSLCHSTDVGTATRQPGDQYVKAYIPVDTCRGCHSMAPCIKCHGLELPHSQEFIDGYHARRALLEPTVCVRCHKAATDCAGCHQFQTDSSGLPIDPHAKSEAAFVTWHAAAKGQGLGSCSCHLKLRQIDRTQFCLYCHGKKISR